MGVFDEQNKGKFVVCGIILMILVLFTYGDNMRSSSFRTQQKYATSILYTWFVFIVVNGLLVGPFIDGCVDKDARQISYTSKLFEMGVFFPLSMIWLLQSSVAYIARQMSLLLINQA